MSENRAPDDREVCDACGFDSELYNRADTTTSQRIIAAVLRAAIEGLDADVLGRRPDEGTWSIGEYIDHVREVAFGNRFVIESALADPGIDLGEPPPDSFDAQAKIVNVDAALTRVQGEYESIRATLESLDDHAWDTRVTAEGKHRTIGWFARHVLHDGLHHLGDIGRIRHQFGHGASNQTGVVTQINVSGGGVPKQPVDVVDVGPRGLGGDVQADRLHHGRPVQAVCLWSADVIDVLQQQGHPIAAGNAGENFTISGIEWADLRPGSRIDIGQVPMLVSAHAVPCAKNAQWFADRDFQRILHDRHPGFSRLYAIPLANGTVATGDRVEVEPDRS